MRHALRRVAAFAITAFIVVCAQLGHMGAASAASPDYPNLYPRCDADEIYDSAQMVGGVEPGGLCYKQCKRGYTGVGVRCYENCEPGTQDLLATCLRPLDVFSNESYGRGVGSLMQCKPGEENIGGLCYSACPANYTNAGFFCAEKCRDGFTDTGLTCGKFLAKTVTSRASSLPNVCPAGRELDTGLCYPVCRNGYSGSLTMCIEDCPAGFETDPLTCRKDVVVLAKDIITRAPYALTFGSCASIGKVQIGELCYPACQAGYDSVGIDCHSRCPSGYTDTGLLCTRGADSYVQTRYSRAGDASTLPCSSTEEQKGLLCYPKCRSGYASVALDCEIPCRSGYSDTGLTCFRPAVTINKTIYSRAGDTSVRPTSCANGGKQIGALCYAQCPASYDEVGFDCHSRCAAGYKDDGLLCRIDARIISRGTYDRGVGSLPSCASGSNIAGVCYQACPAGTDTVGLTCNSRCASGFTDDGLFCRNDYSKDTVSRTSIPGLCGPGEERDGALCYPKCRANFSGVGPVCYKNCPQGYTNDGLFCRRPEKILTRDSYHRGAGRAPDDCNVENFDRTVTGVTEPTGPFTMLFVSDPQFLWLSDGKGALPKNEAIYCEEDPCFTLHATESNRRQVMALNAIQFATSMPDASRGRWPTGPAAGKAAGKPIRQPMGVVVNGDLTAFWQHEGQHGHDEVLLFRRHFEPDSHYAVREALRWPLYPGLGNHDYENNVVPEGATGKDFDDHSCYGGSAHYLFNWSEYACAHEAIDYMKTAVSCGRVKNFPTNRLVSFDRDSLAYAFDIGKYRFIQMQNYPAYTKPEIGIKDSIAWLGKVLDDATAKRKRVVLNFHQPGIFGDGLRNAVRGHDVVAIFNGHQHDLWGWQTTHDLVVDGKRIPAFLSGASEWNRFLLVEFGDDYFSVGVINSSSGQPVFDLADPKNLVTIPLTDVNGTR